MKLPRDLSAHDLEKALRRSFGYEFSRQSGSHRRHTIRTPQGEFHLTIPAHNPIKPGTLRAILGEVASQQLRTQTETLASEVPNVKQVVNELQVKGQKATSSK